jgi:hypothetical protein
VLSVCVGESLAVFGGPRQSGGVLGCCVAAKAVGDRSG